LAFPAQLVTFGETDPNHHWDVIPIYQFLR
jgi:hypothetical protein